MTHVMMSTPGATLPLQEHAHAVNHRNDDDDEEDDDEGGPIMQQRTSNDDHPSRFPKSAKMNMGSDDEHEGRNAADSQR